MKKTLIALAALAATAGVAHAQSSVTLYGLMDVNFGSFKTNAVVGNTVQDVKQTKIDSGGLNGSRWGMRFKEDLGGGLAAVGNLESGINADTGSSAQGGLLFGRRANVGLSGDSFGTVVLGRNSSSYDDVAADHAMMAATIFDPSNTNNGNAVAAAQTLASSVTVAPNGVRTVSAAGAVPFLNRNTTWIGYNTRFNNSIKYTTPNFSGFSGSFMYALGEDKTTAVKASKTVSANLKYTNGPLLVSGGYQSEAAGGSLGSANLNNGGNKPALENTLLNVAYDFGVAKVGAGFNRAKYKDVFLSAAAGGGEVSAQKEYSLSVAVPLGATTISADIAQSKGDTLGKSTGFGIQALYSLSKRTTLYVGGLSTKNYDKLIAALPAGSSAGKTVTFATGIRHTF